MKKIIQLKPGLSPYSRTACWYAEPLGENSRRLPRTNYPSVVTVGNYHVDLQTGEAKIAGSAVILLGSL
jgi:hypothetical protein